MTEEVAADDAAVWSPTWGQVVAMLLVACFFGGAVTYAAVQFGDRRPARSSADVGFLYDMIAHHEQAQELSIIELSRGAEEAVEVYAKEILLQQSYEIGLMEAYLNEWRYDRSAPPQAMGWMQMRVRPERMLGLATEAEVAAFTASTGRDADAMFIRLMKSHHEGGIHMATAAARLAKDTDVRELAARMAEVQRAEIGELEGTRTRLELPS